MVGAIITDVVHSKNKKYVTVIARALSNVETELPEYLWSSWKCLFYWRFLDR